MFKDFGKRLQRDVSKIVKSRMAANTEKMSHLNTAQVVKVGLIVLMCIHSDLGLLSKVPAVCVV